MPLHKCPKPEVLLELVTIPRELSLISQLCLRLHLIGCRECQAKTKAIRKSWEACINPEPDITSSLVRVYSRLKSDETLVLAGWKLGRTHRQGNGLANALFGGGWLFRGGVALGIASVGFMLLLNPFRPTPVPEARMTSQDTLREIPFMQFRVKDRNSVKVHYLQPELLQTIEFETASAE